jgi:large subunit ribosomal protein L6
MSRFGKLPVSMPAGVTVNVTDGSVVVTGPKGSQSQKLPREVGIATKENEVVVEKKGNSKQALALQGTIRSHVVNMITGVTTGWQKQLELIGSGYRAEVRGRDIVLTVGYSHPITISAPEGVSFSVEKTIVTVSGANRADVGQVAALIRATRKPDPYRGKGVKYVDEVIRRKPGKQAAKAAA